jgi:glycosyltransferase involved in cell wall biosynthesis
MPRKLRVLFLEPKHYTGSEFTVQSQLMRYLDRTRTEVFVACEPGTSLRRTDTFTALAKMPDIELRPIHFGPSITGESWAAIARGSLESGIPALWSLPALAYYARSRRIDIVHAGFKPRDAFSAVILARLIGARSILHLHCACGTWMRPLSRWALAHADGVLAVSEYAAQSAVSIAGTQPARLHIVRNGLELQRFDPLVDRTPIRREFGIPDSAPVIVAVSRICPWKGLADLIQSLVRLRAQLPEIRLLIVGEDDLGVTPGRQSYTAELRRITVDLGMQDQVIFTGHRKDVPSILAAADVFALPSPEEGFGMAYLEAMAMKKPVIGLALGGPLELIESGKSGFLIEPGNIDQLVSCAGLLLTDKQLCARMGEYGRRRVEEHFTMPLIAEDVLKVYQDLINPPLHRTLRYIVGEDEVAAS